jgi:hypothetical protein
MADASLLAQIIAGQDPLSAQMLQGQQGAQLAGAALNPEFGHNEGIAGALAKTLAGFSGHDMLNNAVQNTTQARIGAQSDMARLLASNQPYQEMANNPGGYSPLARAALLNGASPLQAAQTKEALANAALANLNVTGFGNAQANPSPATAGVGAPAMRRVAPLPAGNFTALGSGRYPQAPAGPEQGQGQGADLLGVAAALPEPQRAALLRNPATRAQYLALLRARQAAGQPPPPSQAAGVGNAAGP